MVECVVPLSCIAQQLVEKQWFARASPKATEELVDDVRNTHWHF